MYKRQNCAFLSTPLLSLFFPRFFFTKLHFSVKGFRGRRTFPMEFSGQPYILCLAFFSGLARSVVERLTAKQCVSDPVPGNGQILNKI